MLLRFQQINKWIYLVFVMIRTSPDFKLILYKYIYIDHIYIWRDVIHDLISNMYINKLFSMSYIIFTVIKHFSYFTIIIFIFFSRLEISIRLYPTWDWRRENPFTLFVHVHIHVITDKFCIVRRRKSVFPLMLFIDFWCLKTITRQKK